MDPHKSSYASGTLSNLATDLHWKGTWHELKGRAKQIWGSLTDRDLNVVPEGKYEELVGVIQQYTGESVERVRQKLFGDA